MTPRLLTLGDLQLTASDGAPIAFPAKGLLMACYLAATGNEEVERATIARLLWEGEDRAAALVNLRKTVSRIAERQTEIGVEFLKFTPTSVILDHEKIVCDLTEITRLVVADPIQRLQRYVSLFRHDFLETLDFQTVAFSDWVCQVRDRHAQILLLAFKDAACHATADDAVLMKDAAISLLRSNPSGRGIHQLLLETFAADGEVATFRNIFERRKDTIWGDLSLAANAQSLDLAQKFYEKRRADARVAARVDEPEAPAEGGPFKQVPRVALLPPMEIGSVGSLSAMAELLLQDITIGLSAERGLRVVAPFSSGRLSRHIDKVGLIRKYAIGYFLETRISAADETSIFAQLIQTSDDAVIWAARFSLEGTGLPSQRQNIARRLILSVIGEVQRNELISGYQRHDPIAYGHYLIGQHHLQNLTLPNLHRAAGAFQAALDTSPYFAPALSGLARVNCREWLLTARGDSEYLRMSEIYANRAITAGQNLADGYRELGVTKLFLGDLDESLAALEIAEALSPHYADVIADHADTLVHASNPAGGLERIQQAIDLNPLCPDHYHWKAAGANYYLGQYDDALAAIAEMENAVPAARLAAASWAMLGNQEQAGLHVQKVRELYPDFNVDEWLKIIPIREQWQKDHYREGLRKAGF